MTLSTIVRNSGRIIRARTYALTGPIGKKLQHAHLLQNQIQLLEQELKELRLEMLAHMESSGLDRIGSGDVRLTRKIRHDWTYSETVEREMLHLKQIQKLEQTQGIAKDTPTVYAALSTIQQ